MQGLYFQYPPSGVQAQCCRPKHETYCRRKSCLMDCPWDGQNRCAHDCVPYWESETKSEVVKVLFLKIILSGWTVQSYRVIHPFEAKRKWRKKYDKDILSSMTKIYTNYRLWKSNLELSVFPKVCPTHSRPAHRSTRWINVVEGVWTVQLTSFDGR